MAAPSSFQTSGVFLARSPFTAMATDAWRGWKTEDGATPAKKKLAAVIPIVHVPANVSPKYLIFHQMETNPCEEIRDMSIRKEVIWECTSLDWGEISVVWVY